MPQDETLRENEAMRRTLQGRYNRDRELRPRDGEHSPYTFLSCRVSDTRVRQGTKDLRDAFFTDWETCFPASTYPITVFRKRIEADMTALAAASDYEGSIAPRVQETRFSLPRGANRWVITVIFDRLWPVVEQEGGSTNENV